MNKLRHCHPMYKVNEHERESQNMRNVTTSHPTAVNNSIKVTKYIKQLEK